MDTTPVRSAQRVVETIDLAGVRYVFGIPGAKIDAVFDALLEGTAELVVCRHEQNAAFMAAAIGRLTGTPGVVLVTSGPGTTNLATGLVTATTEQDPVVAICGAVNRDQRLKRTHQSMDAARLLGAVTKYVGEVAAPDDVAETVANAFRLAATHPRGATAVLLPADVAAAVTAAALTTMPTVPRMGSAPAAGITRAAEAVLAAHAPVVLVGDRGSDPEITAALHRLIADTDLPVVETFQAAGVISRELETHYLGRVGLFRNQPGDVVLARADVVIAVGYDPVEYDAQLWNTDPTRTVIHIDAVPAAIDNHYRPAIELHGDVAATLGELAPLLSGLRVGAEVNNAIAEQRDRLTAIDQQARATAESEHGLNPAAVVLTLRDHLSDDATVACDVGSNYIYMARHFRCYRPRHLLFSNGQQTLGVALPWAIAAALVRPDTQIVSVSGDGGFLFSAQELETAQRLGVTLTHIILRDDTYDMVAFQEVMKYGRTSGIQLGSYDTVSYAAAFGAHGYRVNTMAEFVSTLETALAEPGVSIIDVPVDYSHNVDLGQQLHDDAFH
ncbi:acetolactate synthase AlsS [Mycobacterium neglectum]|uniref:acetolactate synthase AlsS n=1 Tax=Mycobacterium neglectum TaxID=242737 RepID=UPI000BFF0F8F|nr:acetolactate synthase AlsS [Mycobacterium neglectum]